MPLREKTVESDPLGDLLQAKEATMDKNLLNKFKSGISTQQMEDFAHKYTPEVFGICALFVGTISSLFDFFTNSNWSILFFAVGTILGIVFAADVEMKLRRIYHFISNQDKTTEMILGGIKIVVALFLPFLFFGFLGLFAGTSYRHHLRQTHEDRKPR